MECTGASYGASTRSPTLERWVRLDSKVDDTPGLIQLLQEILVFDPLRRPSVSDILEHPWFVGSSDTAAIPGVAQVSDSSSSEDYSDSSSSEDSESPQLGHSRGTGA